MARSGGLARARGTASMCAVLLGGAFVLVSIIALTWYDYGGGADSVDRVRFRDLAATADHVDVPGVVPAYFDWLVWVLLLAVVVVATAAYVRPAASGALRIVGFAAGALGCFLTWYALQQLTSYAFRSATAGVWLTLAGFALAAVGAALAPRPV